MDTCHCAEEEIKGCLHQREDQEACCDGYHQGTDSLQGLSLL